MKTAKELGITENQLEAFLKLREGLCEGKYSHVDIDHLPDETISDIIENGFNMAMWNERTSCGTVCCVGGWVEQLSNERFNMAGDGVNDGLLKLFYPISERWKKITPKQAAAAINNFLNEGDPHWGDVISGV